MVNIPVIRKIMTSRMHKDCTLNAMGKWNAADSHCYAYIQLESLCLIIDSYSKDFNLISNYQDTKCSGKGSSYASYSSLGWTKKEGEPTIYDITNDIEIIIYSNKDPYYMLMSNDFSIQPSTI